MTTVGYVDRLSVAPGEALQCMVHCEAETFRAEVVQLRAPGSAHPAVPSHVDATYSARRQELHPGSYLRADAPFPPEGLRVTAWIRPTTCTGVRRAVVTWGSSLGLFVGEDGALSALAGDVALESEEPLVAREWHWVQLTLDPRAHELALEWHRKGHVSVGARRSVAWHPDTPLTRNDCLIAGVTDDGGVTANYDGKIARVRVESTRGACLAEWDFASDHGSNLVRDRGPAGRHAIAVNHPQRAVTGPDRRGNSLDHRLSPDEYDAIAFHSDDLGDAEWRPSFEWRIPDDWDSGVFAVRLTGVDGDGEDYVPFFVRRAPGSEPASVAFLAPTFTYVAYGNERHWWTSPAVEALTGSTAEELVDDREQWAKRHGLLSVYDSHVDGTGNCYASHRRPLTNLQPNYHHPLIRGPHQLSADLHILAWLEANGFVYDVLTDHDLHREGSAALQEYRTIVTGSHPEFASEELLDAIADYVADGGHVVSLGGNAFCWVTSVHGEEDHVIEVRRGWAGTRPWESEPGETHHSTTGEPGGMWRHRGRAPQRLLGPGWGSFSLGPAQPYVRTENGQSERFRWVFEGVPSDTFGAFGDLLGGAAGFEMDHVDARLGTPAETFVLATASGFDPGLSASVVEDMVLTRPVSEPRADLTITEFSGGGSVFATGSSCWATSLLANGGDNDVARITRNVVSRYTGT